MVLTGFASAMPNRHLIEEMSHKKSSKHMFRELIYFWNKKKGFLWGISRDWFIKFSQLHSIIQIMSLAGSVRKKT